MTEFAGHEDLAGFGDGEAVEQGLVDEFDDGHFDAEAAGQGDGAAGGVDAFGDHDHAGLDVVEGSAGGELLADVVVAGMGAGAGGDEVAHAGQARQR